MLSIGNKTFDEIKVGDIASTQRTLQAGDVRAWATAFGDVGLLAQPDHGAGTAGIVSVLLTSLVGTTLPGPGSSVRSAAVQLRAPLPINNVLTAKIAVREKRADEKLVVFDGECTDAAGLVVATAALEVLAPLTRVKREVPEHKLEGLLDRCRGLEPMLTGVVHPCSADALAGAVEAAEAKLIVPVLFGPEAELRRVAAAAKLDLSGCRIVATESPEDSAAKAPARSRRS